MVNILTLVGAISAIAPFVHAYGMVGQVVDADNFCVFLPPKDSKNRNIADTEWEGQAFCRGNTPKATNAGKLNNGFIKSAHFLATDTFVQVTGQMDPSQQKLNATDEGGQFDVKAPKGSSCAGWKFYVNLIEPVTKTYCMRCCNDNRTCNRGISEKGCFHIIPGDYSGPYGDVSNGYPNDSEAAASSGGASVAKTTSAVEKAKTKTIKATTTATTSKPVTTKVSTRAEAHVKTQATQTTLAITTTQTSISIQTIATTTQTLPKITQNAIAVDSISSSSTESTSNFGSSSKLESSETSQSKSSNVALGANDEVTVQSVSGVDVFKPAFGAIACTIGAALLLF
ncbi:hypothetical protein BY458DRAFT_501800 [Sporodiniella umbellata]|nr:hypothetical protein BY458DRAFT_501800 [Sporodiniella umbellata]